MRNKMRDKMKKIVRNRKFLVLYVLVVLLMLGIIWQSIMIGYEYKLYPVVGEYVDVGTYKAHYYSKGEGETAFVFITGSGTPSSYTDFYFLQNEMSTKGQAITFDHAGSGWSTDTKDDRCIENLTKNSLLLWNQ